MVNLALNCQINVRVWFRVQISIKACVPIRLGLWLGLVVHLKIFGGGVLCNSLLY